MLATGLVLRICGLSHDDRVKLLSLICEEKEGYDCSLLMMFKGLLEKRVDSGYWDSTFAPIVHSLLWDNELDAYRSDWPDSTLVEKLAGDLNWALTHWGSRADALPSFLSGLSAFAWDFLDPGMNIMPMVYLNKMFRCVVGGNYWDDIMTSREAVYTSEYITCMLAAGIFNIGVRTNVSGLMGLAHGDPYVTDSNGHAGQFSVLTGKAFADMPDSERYMIELRDTVQDVVNVLGNVSYNGKSWRRYCSTVTTAACNDKRVKDLWHVIESVEQYAQSEYERLMHRSGIGKLAVLTPAQVMASIFGADVVIK